MMRAIRDFFSKFAQALASSSYQPSRYVCAACDVRDHCSLPPGRRRLCWETRAQRPLR